MTICKTINRKIQIDERRKSFLKCIHCQFIFVHSLSKKQESNDIKHHLKNFDCIKNQSTEHLSIQEQIDFLEAIKSLLIITLIYHTNDFEKVQTKFNDVQFHSQFIIMLTNCYLSFRFVKKSIFCTLINCLRLKIKIFERIKIKSLCDVFIVKIEQSLLQDFSSNTRFSLTLDV